VLDEIFENPPKNGIEQMQFRLKLLDVLTENAFDIEFIEPNVTDEKIIGSTMKVKIEDFR
jgi:hypothetical protein